MSDARGTLLPGVGHVPMPLSGIERTLAAAIEDRIAATPDAIALRMDDRLCTYAQLGQSADRVAQELRTAGVGDHPGSDGLPPVVAVLASQSIDLVVAIVGVLKAGAAYLPVDPTHPPARSSDLLDVVGVAAMACDQRSGALARRIAGRRRPVVTASIEGPPVDRPPRKDDPGAIAYMYATSGSTGRPKIVLDSHRNVLHNIRRYTNSLAIGPGDRLSLVQASTFSGAVSSLFGALLNGATCHLFDLRRDGAAALGPWVREARLTMFHAVPVLFRAICTAGAFYPEVRVVRLEGDAAAWSDVELFHRHFARGAVLVNGLGATETGLVRQYFVDHESSGGHGGLPLGYAVPDMEVRLVDEAGAPVPPGHTGEIEVRSPYLAHGYHNDEQRTVRSFRRDEGGGRRYRTGDLGKFVNDGCLLGLGRRDFTEKIRGETVDLAEVELHLRAQAGIREAVVVTRRDGPEASARLVAYLVTEAGASPSPEGLRRSLTDVLPRSSVPSVFVTLRALPLDASSKIDRARLPAPGATRPPLSTPFVAPRSPIEEMLVGLWEELLGIRGIGVHDEFFDLGGDSLDAARLALTLAERSGAAVADQAVANASTIEGLARRLSGSTTDATAPILFAIPGDRFNGEFYSRPRRALDGRVALRPLPPTVAGTDPVDIATDATLLAGMIRAAQPEGPYHIVGFCFGAVTALEVAHRLQDEGGTVATLTLLAISPLEFPTLVDRASAPSVIRRGAHWLRVGLMGLRAAGGVRERERYIARNLLRIARSTLRSIRQRLARHGLGSQPPPDDVEGRHAAIRALPARPFDGRVLVILGASSAGGYTRRPDRAWAGLGHDVQVVLLPGGDHDMLVNPLAHALAESLTAEVVGRDSTLAAASDPQQA